MNRAFLSEFTSIPWAMEPAALEAFLLQISELPSAVAAGSAGAAASRRSRLSMGEDGTATIGISGVLMKSVPAWMRFYGVDASGYDEIAADLADALADPNTKAIQLRVSSPGGQVAGVKEVADALFAARKTHPMHATVEDLCASGGYWLASQAGKISAGRNALVGSIGVYSAFMDLSRLMENIGIKVHVVASGPHKGMGVPGAPISAEQLGAMQEVIDGMASNFVDDVARGMGMKREDVEKCATGRVWIATEAKAQGLIQSITASPTKAAAAHVGTAANIETPEEEETAMAETPSKPAAAAPETPAATQRKIATPGELKAAFPGESAFVLDQIEAGASLIEAEASFAKVLKSRLEASQKENAELRKKPAQARGADPLPNEGEPGAQAEQSDFLGRAQKLAEEKGWPVRRAMSHLARTEPQLYESYMREIGAGDIVDRRRVADGAKRR